MGLITMEGACDLHIHTSPDIFERIADDVRTAEACRDAGMKAIVFKCHADTTMTRAWHTERQVPGIRVFGGIVLNLNVGGINPAAVDVALKLGAVEVWMPSYHSLAHYKATGKMGGYGHQGSDVTTNYPVKPITILDEKGELIPEIWPILELVKQHDAILGTSHLGSEEGLKLIRAAREVGCRKVVLTHPFFAPPSCTVRQIKEAVELGAFCEFCSGNALSPIPAPIPAGALQGSGGRLRQRTLHYFQRHGPSQKDHGSGDQPHVRPEPDLQGREAGGRGADAQGQLPQTA